MARQIASLIIDKPGALDKKDRVALLAWLRDTARLVKKDKLTRLEHFTAGLNLYEPGEKL